MKGNHQEPIVVTEADLRRCGHSLALLRQCHVQPSRAKDEESRGNEKELSFKSAFNQKCRADQPPRNPWLNIANPEEIRDDNEKDLILNQVWTERLAKKKVARERVAREDEAIHAGQDVASPQRSRSIPSSSTRASSADSPPGHRDGSDSRGRKGNHRQPRTRPHSLGPTADRQPENRAGSARAGSQSRRNSHSSGCPRPRSGPCQAGSASKQADSKPTKYESRIKVIDDKDEGEADTVIAKGSLAVRAASVKNRRFERPVEEQEQSRIVWLSLDPLTGEVELYNKAAAQRLESAYVHNKAHVPMAGLGGDLEWAIVYLGSREAGNSESGSSHATQLSNGEHRDVRRITVPATASQVCVKVAQDNMWRIADCDVPGEVEERHVDIFGYPTIRAQSPSLPPVDPNRRLQFHNPGAEYQT